MGSAPDSLSCVKAVPESLGHKDLQVLGDTKGDVMEAPSCGCVFDFS